MTPVPKHPPRDAATAPPLCLSPPPTGGRGGAAPPRSGPARAAPRPARAARRRLRVLQEMSGLPGRVSLVALSIDGGPEAVARAAAAAQAALPGAAARPLGQIAAAQGALLARLDRMMAVLTIAVLLLSGLCLLTTLMSMVVEREGEIGLMRSMGAGDGVILAMFAGEVSLLGLLGALLGWGLGALSAGLIGAKLFGAAIAARAEVAPGIALGCVVLCFMAVLLPLRRALAIQPAAVLRGE